MKRLLFSVAIVSAVSGASFATAADDSCDDYVSRHYRADLVPLSASATNVPRSGDISGFQSLDVVIVNQGEVELQGPTSGLLAAKPLSITVSRAWDRLLRRPWRHTYQGSINTPLASGAKTVVSVSMSTGTVSNCARVGIRIDSRRTAGQHGCAVYGNDFKEFQIHVRGEPRCRNLIVRPSP